MEKLFTRFSLPVTCLINFAISEHIPVWSMAAQVKEYMDRMVKADGEAGKAQADANKAQKALRQLETDVDALRCKQLFSFVS